MEIAFVASFADGLALYVASAAPRMGELSIHSQTGMVRFAPSSAPGATVIIERSEDLKNWRVTPNE
jgi:hypothetical protein